MPNWCSGYVGVEGKAKDIESFCKLFIFCEDVGTKKGKYFARSFIQESWKDFHEEYIKDYEPNEETDIEFNVDFAWSCHSCLIEGYPEDFKECVTLEWACKKYNVEVKIKTEESGMSFEEEISYTKEDGLSEQCFDMPIYVCKCGEERNFPSDCDYLDEEECYECEKIGEFKLK